MLIKVKTLTGKEIEIDIEPTDKVERIKERVEEKEGIPPAQQSINNIISSTWFASMNTVAIKRKHVNQLRKTKQKTRRSSVKVDTTSKERENFIKKKIRKLNDALESDPVDVDLLRKLMLSKEGCITEDIRCKVWPKLLNVNLFEYPRKKNADVELKEFQDNKWWRQVNLDVNRSHRRFPLETRLSRKRILQHQLTNIIMRVLCRNSHLHYYQGYHDIAVTLLRVVGEDVATLLLDKLSNTHIIDFMDTNMNRTSRMLSFFYAVMGKEDPTLEQFLLKSEVGTLFAVSWLITWFGHDINGFDLVVRLFDVFLASHPIMPVYFSVALVIVHRQQVLERDCDMAMVYHCLSRLPSYIGVDDIEKLITYAYELYVKHPPDSLKREVRKYLRESDSIVHHTELVYQSYNQRPDSVLRRRKKYGRFFTDSSKSVNAAALSTADTVLAKHSQNVNPLVKAAVWTMTLSMGVMTFLVLNTTKHWL